jgi:hypothetical protein
MSTDINTHEIDEAVFRRIHTEVERGHESYDAMRRVAKRMAMSVPDVRASYYRHARRAFGQVTA